MARLLGVMLSLWLSELLALLCSKQGGAGLYQPFDRHALLRGFGIFCSSGFQSVAVLPAEQQGWVDGGVSSATPTSPMQWFVAVLVREWWHHCSE